jgi:PAS domain S-box-containing protein
MIGLEHDLLLLMLNLSRLRDRETIKRLFVEALSTAVPGVSLRYLAPGEQTQLEVVEVATPEAHFGRIAIEDPAGMVTAPQGAPLRNAIRMLAVVLENVARAERLASENSRLDKAVASRTAELQRSLSESDDLYQNAACGYHSLNTAGEYVRVNDTELRWLGYGREELLAGVSFLSLVAEESRSAFARSFALLKEQGGVQDVEIDLLRKDGSRLPVLQSATAVTDAHGRFVMSRATVYDLSERRKAERDLRESEERFWQSQKLEALGRLAGGVAHDFNNLLTVIIACSEMVRESLDPADPAYADAESVLDAGQKAASLTRQLLAFGRRQPRTPLPTDLGGVVAGMENMLRRLIGEDVDFQIFRGTALRLVQVDTGQIEQVILNLAVNARDAMPQGGTLRIETINRDIEQDGVRREYVMLAVSDTGVGILPEARAHLFEPFFTTKEKGKGTGLGLATVYGIVQQAGGNVSVDSATGKGTRFEVLFPATDAQNEPAAASKPTGMQRGTGTILVVDDEPQVRATAARVLREAGYTVFEAADGGQAMAIAETLPKLDLLLTDVVMPRMSGFELASQLGRSTLDLKVIFMSGYSSDVRSLAIQPAVRFATLLEKPFTVGSLTGAVRERLNAPLIPATASSRPPSSTIRQPT